MKKMFAKLIVVGTACLMSLTTIAQETPVSVPVSAGSGSASGGGSVSGPYVVEKESPTLTPPVPHPAFLPMITSQDVLREFALDMSRRGNRWVDAPSMDWNLPRIRTSVSIYGVGAESILDQLFNTELVYSLGNPDDEITGRVELYSANDVLLFFGQAIYTAADVGGKTKPQYSIWPQTIPILDGVRSAEVLAIDVDGKTANRIPLEVRNGQLLFQPWMAGSTNGILSVKFTDGALVTYTLSNPIAHNASISNEKGLPWKIEGHYVVGIDDQVESRFVKIIEPWLKPTVKLTVLSVALPVVFDVVGIIQEGTVSLERPTDIVFTQVGGPVPVSSAFLSDRPTPINFPKPGVYRIHFKWNKFGKPQNFYTGPQDGVKG